MCHAPHGFTARLAKILFVDLVAALTNKSMTAFPGRGWTDAEKAPAYVGLLSFMGIYEVMYLEFASRLHQADGPFKPSSNAERNLAASRLRPRSALVDAVPLLQIADLDGSNQGADEASAEAAAKSAAASNNDVWKERQKEQAAFRTSVCNWVRTGNVLADSVAIQSVQLPSAVYMSRLIKRTAMSS